MKAGPYTVQGVSLGGVYTSLAVPELGVVLDAGIPIRRFAGYDHVFLSHAHADHVGGLGGLLGIRGLVGKPRPKVYLPAAIAETLTEVLEGLTKLQRYDLSVELVPLEPGDVAEVGKGLFVRAFKTHHPVPSLGYQFFRRIQKLRPEFVGLPGDEIGRRRKRGEDLFDELEQLELAYATDTLARVLETSPSVLDSRVLVLECTFLDGRKSRDAARQGCHVHLDDLLEAAPPFRNEHLVLMHFSQLYAPDEVHRILDERLPPELRAIVRPLAPKGRHWPY